MYFVNYLCAGFDSVGLGLHGDRRVSLLTASLQKAVFPSQPTSPVDSLAQNSCQVVLKVPMVSKQCPPSRHDYDRAYEMFEQIHFRQLHLRQNYMLVPCFDFDLEIVTDYQSLLRRWEDLSKTSDCDLFLAPDYESGNDVLKWFQDQLQPKTTTSSENDYLLLQTAFSHLLGYLPCVS